MNPTSLCLLALLIPSAVLARPVAWYAFDAADPTGSLADRSGFGHDLTFADDPTLSPEGALECTGKGYAVLPGGAEILGPVALQGTVSLWVRPDFAPDALSSGAWEGYRMIFYAMKTDGNGLPDGDNEIGLWCHGPSLLAKIAGASYSPTFSVTNTMAPGVWHHLVITWGPSLRALYLDGQLLDRDTSLLDPPLLDDFPAMLGQHSSSKAWAWEGALADCRIFDETLSEARVAELYAAGRNEGVPVAPESPLRAVDWGPVWVGAGTARVQTQAGPLGDDVELLCEVLDAKGRTAGQPLQATLRGQGSYQVPFTVAGEGWTRLNLILRAAEGGQVLGARSTFVQVPPLTPSLDALAASLGEAGVQVEAGQMPAATREALRASLRDLTRRSDELTFARANTTDAAAWDELITRARDLQVQADRLLTRATILARGGSAEAAPAFGLGFDHSLRKRLRDDPFLGRLEEPAELRAARNEYEACQLVVFSLDEPLTGVSLDLGPLTGPGGATIPASALSWNRLGWVQTSPPSYAVRHVGLWPDPLLPPAPFDVAAGSFETAWITLKVPRDVPAGRYTGTVTVSAANAPARRIALNLSVWDFTLPDESSLPTAFGLNSMGSFQGQMDVDKYVSNAREHRISLGFPGLAQTPATVVPARFRLAGQTLSFRVRVESDLPGPLFLTCRVGDEPHPRAHGPLPFTPGEWSLIEVPMAQDENPSGLTLEWRNAGPARITLGPVSAGERLLDPMTDPRWWDAVGPWTSVEAAPGGLSLIVSPAPADQALIGTWPGLSRQAAASPADEPLALDFTAFDAAVERNLGATGIQPIWLALPGCPRHTSAAEAQRIAREGNLGPIAAAYEKHLREKGWLERAYTYVADEPEADDYPALNVIQGTIKQWAPGLANMMTARSFPPELTNVDIWCPEICSYSPDLCVAEQAKGKRVWWYPAFSTRHPFPDFWVDYPAVDCRIVFWLTWKHKLDGLLYWSITNYWKANPWENAMTFPGANGDGTLVYPGEDRGPVNSLRWECIREGAEDYEYFVLLRDLVARAEAAGLPAADLQPARALLAIDDRVAASWREWTQDPDVLLAARNEVGDAIQSLTEALR